MTEDARKDDGGKLRYDLIPPEALEELARVYTVGAERYGERNWERGITWGRLFAALTRHLWAWWRGEMRDPEDGLPHLAHAAWGCFALAVYEERGVGRDDRKVGRMSAAQGGAREVKCYCREGLGGASDARRLQQGPLDVPDVGEAEGDPPRCNGRTT